MKLRELIAQTPYVLETRGDMETEIREITSSSRDKTQEGCFSALWAPSSTPMTMPGKRWRTDAWR